MPFGPKEFSDAAVDAFHRPRIEPGTSGESDVFDNARSLIGFVKLGWPILEPATPYVHGKHIAAIAEHLEAVTSGQIRNLLINLPPRHMKSLMVSVFWPVWEWIANPHRRWLFASYALSLSIRDSVRCRRLIESPWFAEHFGKRFQLTSDQNQKMRFDNDHSGCRIATSVGGAATGEGGDRVVVDDPHNVAQRESDSIRQATLQWWDQTMSTRLNDPKTGSRVIVMQRIHEKDLSGHVLGQGGYVHLCLPAEFELSRRCVTRLPWADWRTGEGDLLWPERISESEISDFKLRLGPSGYAGQFQQRPAPEGGARFRKEWFRYYRSSLDGGATSYPLSPREKGAELATARDRAGVRANDERQHSQPDATPVSPHPNPLPGGEGAMRGRSGIYALHRPDGRESIVRLKDCSRFAVMDPAGTEPDQNNRPCYTVIQVWDVTPNHEMILVHQYRAQVQAPDAAKAAERIAREFDVAFIAIEKDGIGLGIVQAVRRNGITVKPIKARGSKEARSETAEIRMAAGMIYFPHNAPFLWELEQELLHFPQGDYCDQVDALAHAAMQVQRLGGPPRAEREQPVLSSDSLLDPDHDEWI